MKEQTRSNLLARNVRYMWLAALFIPPSLAFGAYEITPHEEVWHEILYSLLCVPLFLVWLLALLACVLSFVIHRTLSRA